MADIYNPNQDIHIDRASRKLVVRKQQDTNPILEESGKEEALAPKASKPKRR